MNDKVIRQMPSNCITNSISSHHETVLQHLSNTLHYTVCINYNCNSQLLSHNLNSTNVYIYTHTNSSYATS